MLERGDDAGGLKSPHIGRADGGHQVGVLPDGLLDAAPAGVADHVEHRGEALVHADGPHVAADGRGHAVDQVRVEGGAPGQRDGIGGGLPGRKAGQALLVRDGGDAETVRRGDARLRAQQGERAESGVDGSGAEGTGQLAQAVRQEGVEVDGLLHVVLMGGHFTPLVGRADPHTVELCDLLLEGHGTDQGGHPGVDVVGRIVPDGDFGGGLNCHVGGHFPPTPMSPWTRARRANR
ncbi:hypothetical protein MBT84_41685 [Streptomyces sp. MBT84]|nr:hypothetical protein [Streptomyces sp. MBT84]